MDAIYRGTERQVQIMKEESTIQFYKGKMPRFFIKFDDLKTDPYDVIDLCIAKERSNGRRIFTYASNSMTGKVKDVTSKLIQ